MTTPGVEPARLWVLTIIAPGRWLTANDLNGRHHRYTRSTLTKTWRAAACVHARHAGLPTGLDCVRIDAVARFQGRPPVRDRDNLRPTLKAVIDGLGPAKTFTRRGKLYHSPGHGLTCDDNDQHLASSDIRIGDPLPRHTTLSNHPGLLQLTITEVTDAARTA